MITIIAEEPNRKPAGVVGFRTHAEREAWAVSATERGINYFVFYKDTQADFAAQFTVCEWKTQECRRWTWRNRGYSTWGPNSLEQLQGPHCHIDHRAYVRR